MVMASSVRVEIEMPDGMKTFRLPKGLHQRLQNLLDRQDSGTPLTPEEREEATGLVDMAEWLSLVRLRLPVCYNVKAKRRGKTMTLTVDVEPKTLNYLLRRAEADALPVEDYLSRFLDSLPEARDSDLLFAADEEPPLLQLREGKPGKMRVVSIGPMPFPAPDDDQMTDLS